MTMQLGAFNITMTCYEITTIFGQQKHTIRAGP